MSAGYSGKPPVEKLVSSRNHVALATGMGDTKVCAIDKTWSGLRLTRRRS